MIKSFDSDSKIIESESNDSIFLSSNFWDKNVPIVFVQ